MQRYYFHVRQGGSFQEDTEGAEFPSREAARLEAIKAAREILSNRVWAGKALKGEAFEITSEESSVVDVVPFRLVIRQVK